MSELLSIHELRVSDVREAVMKIIGVERPVETLGTWLASVDWSGERADAEVVALLGELEGIVTEAEENELNQEEFIRHARAAIGRQAVRR